MVIQLKVALSQKENEHQLVIEQLKKSEQTEGNLRQLVTKLEEDLRKGLVAQNPQSSPEMINPINSSVRIFNIRIIFIH